MRIALKWQRWWWWWWCACVWYGVGVRVYGTASYRTDGMQGVAVSESCSMRAGVQTGTRQRWEEEEEESNLINLKR